MARQSIGKVELNVAFPFANIISGVNDSGKEAISKYIKRHSFAISNKMNTGKMSHPLPENGKVRLSIRSNRFKIILAYHALSFRISCKTLAFTI